MPVRAPGFKQDLVQDPLLNTSPVPCSGRRAWVFPPTPILRAFIKVCTEYSTPSDPLGAGLSKAPDQDCLNWWVLGLPLSCDPPFSHVPAPMLVHTHSDPLQRTETTKNNLNMKKSLVFSCLSFLKVFGMIPWVLVGGRKRNCNIPRFRSIAVKTHPWRRADTSAEHRLCREVC